MHNLKCMTALHCGWYTPLTRSLIPQRVDLTNFTSVFQSNGSDTCDGGVDSPGRKCRGEVCDDVSMDQWNAAKIHHQAKPPQRETRWMLQLQPAADSTADTWGKNQVWRVFCLNRSEQNSRFGARRHPKLMTHLFYLRIFHKFLSQTWICGT